MMYRIQALDSSGRFITLDIDAPTPKDARQQGTERGLQVLDICAGEGFWHFAWRRRSSKFPLLLFNQELLALLEAGLSIVEALETLLEKESHADNRHVLQSVVSSLHEGRPLSAALESRGDTFPPLFVAAMRASERSGNLAESLRRYISYQLQIDQMRKKIVAASIYPALLMLVGGLVVLFLLSYVIPKFSHIYADTGRDLPLASQLLMQWGTLIEDHGTLVGGIFIVLLGGAAYAFSRSGVRGWLRERLWRLPVIGERMRIYQLSRFYRTLGMLAGSGIPLLSALDRVGGLLDSRLQVRLDAARNYVREGLSLSQAMERSGLSTVVASRLLRVGERSGQMGAMMDRIADFHEEELSRWIDWASRLFEPLLMTFIGVVIGVIVVLMYVPIFELAGSIQ